ncbi:MAG TPA: helix-turn-helix domain-containing protein [Nitrospira sp.]|nr:helix-turn-helix domain-containing protein [Nitrospira sp.]
MVRYRRLTLMEHEEISRLLAVGYSLRATAHVLGRVPSTLVRELVRHRIGPRLLGPPFSLRRSEH